MNFPLKKVHFIGIGGIGMSAIAEMLQVNGVLVQGSNDKENDNTQRLQRGGIPVIIGHHPNNLKDADCVVVSTATINNIETQTAKEKHIPIAHRSEMLAELLKLKKSICIAGTHGKTTTSSLIASILIEAQMHPSFIIGGILNAHKSNAQMGKGDWVVAEADESDGSFLKLPSCVSVVTNIDPEHLDYYKTYDREKQAFVSFLNQTAFYGFNVVCLDHPVIKELLPQIQGRETITYGFDSTANVVGQHVEWTETGSKFDVHIDMPNQVCFIKGVTLNMLGKHNVQNALAAIAVAVRLGIQEDVIKSALASFQGIQRRLSVRGYTKEGVYIYDDYAHHPNEIKASLAALKDRVKGRLIAVWQPHRWTRFKDLYFDFLTAFELADIIGVLDVYAAGEIPINDVSEDQFVRDISKRKEAFKTSLDNLAQDLSRMIQPDDCIVCLGAGSISKMAKQLPEILGGKKND